MTNLEDLVLQMSYFHAFPVETGNYVVMLDNVKSYSTVFHFFEVDILVLYINVYQCTSHIALQN